MSFANNLKQVANLLCDQVNSASYPQHDKKSVVANGLRGPHLGLPPCRGGGAYAPMTRAII